MAVSTFAFIFGLSQLILVGNIITPPAVARRSADLGRWSLEWTTTSPPHTSFHDIPQGDVNEGHEPAKRRASEASLGRCRTGGEPMSDGHHAHVENQAWASRIPLRCGPRDHLASSPTACCPWASPRALTTRGKTPLQRPTRRTHNHHVIDAHLQFLTWNVNTILFAMMSHSFIGLAGLRTAASRRPTRPS